MFKGAFTAKFGGNHIWHSSAHCKFMKATSYAILQVLVKAKIICIAMSSAFTNELQMLLPPAQKRTLIHAKSVLCTLTRLGWRIT